MANTTKIASGNADGLMEFIDWLVEKGYATQASVGPWKSASKQVFRTVEGDGYGSLDLTDMDPDEYMDRFEKLAAGKYKLESLASYRSRFRKALDAYGAYLSNKQLPSFRVSPRSGKVARQPSSGAKSEASASKSRGGSGGGAKAETQSPPRDGGLGLIEYPFPLESGEVARLRLPAELRAADADRIAAFVKTLVFQGGASS